MQTETATAAGSLQTRPDFGLFLATSSQHQSLPLQMANPIQPNLDPSLFAAADPLPLVCRSFFGASPLPSLLENHTDLPRPCPYEGGDSTQGGPDYSGSEQSYGIT